MTVPVQLVVPLLVAFACLLTHLLAHILHRLNQPHTDKENTA